MKTCLVLSAAIGTWLLLASGNAHAQQLTPLQRAQMEAARRASAPTTAPTPQRAPPQSPAPTHSPPAPQRTTGSVQPRMPAPGGPSPALVHQQREYFRQNWFNENQYALQAALAAADASHIWTVTSASSYASDQGQDTDFNSAMQQALDACEADTATNAPDGVGDPCQITSYY